jgi:hypothetical protein
MPCRSGHCSAQAMHASSIMPLVLQRVPHATRTLLVGQSLMRSSEPSGAVLLGASTLPPSYLTSSVVQSSELN